jgi:hypothetical protein
MEVNRCQGNVLPAAATAAPAAAATQHVSTQQQVIQVMCDAGADMEVNCSQRYVLPGAATAARNSNSKSQWQNNHDPPVPDTLKVSTCNLPPIIPTVAASGPVEQIQSDGTQ